MLQRLGRVLLWLTAISCFLNGNLFGQCPVAAEVAAVIERKQLSEMRGLSDQLAPCSGTIDTLAAVLNHTISIKYSGVNADSGAFYTQRALSVRKQLFGRSPTEDLGKSFHNLGVFLNNAGKFRAAVVPLEQAVAIFERMDIAGRLHRSRLQLSQSFGQLGNYTAAKDLLTAAISAGQGDNYALAQSNHDLGLLWQQQGKFMRADTSLSIAASYYLDDPDPDYWGYADCIQTLATVKDELKDFRAATENYLAALRLYSELEDPGGIALAANNLGLAYVENRRTKLGFQYLQRGLNVAREAGLPRMEAQAYDHLGEYYLAVNRPREAVLSFQRAQEVLIPGYAASELTSVPTKKQLNYTNEVIDLLRYLNDQAKGLEALDRTTPNDNLLSAALQAYRQGDLLIDRLREDHDGMATKLIWREKATKLYEAAIRLCHQTDNAIDAYYFFEKSKAVLLYEAMLAADALNVLPDSLRARERELYFAAEAARKQLGKEAGEVADAYANFLANRSALDAFRDTLRQSFPSFNSLKETSGITRWQTLINDVLRPNNQWMVQYFVGTEAAYALVLTPARPFLFTLGSTETLHLEVSGLLEYFSSSGVIANDPVGYTQKANALYRKLLAPLNLPTGQNLLIVPDGLLTYLPFAALTTNPEFPGSFGLLETVLQRHQITYGYSGSVLERQHKLAQRSAGAFGAFAPFGDGSAPTGYPRLDFNSDELSNLVDDFDVVVFKNREATRSFFAENASDYKLLHLSTHAFSSPREQTPHIAFYDTLFYLQDVYRLSLAADLVVLSACQTNIGKNAPGEGTLGLGRGFAQAGARGIVSSLWNVNANSTGNVLTKFYGSLAEGEETGRALHRAKIAYCAEAAIPDLQKSPYHWAGLTYYGPEQSVEIPPREGYLMYLWFLFPLVSILFLAIIRRYS